jgi:osmotically-inducible protein OsmY
MRLTSYLFAAASLLLIAACSMLQTAKVESDVKAALAKDTRTAQYSFDVSCDEKGVVTITGELPEPGLADIVTSIAKVVPGVKEVLNRCSVPEPGSNLMQDTVVDTPYL